MAQMVYTRDYNDDGDDDGDSMEGGAISPAETSRRNRC